MKSIKAVNRPHVHCPSKNQRKRAGKRAKHARQRINDWTHKCVLSDPKARARLETLASLSLIDAKYEKQELSEAERALRAEKRRLKKKSNVPKVVDEETKRLEKERREQQKLERKKVAEEAKKRKEEEEHRKWQEKLKQREEQDKKKKEQEERDREEKKKRAEEEKKRQEEAAKLKKEQDEEKKRLAAEKKKQQEEEQKLKKQQEEERKQKEKEEAERKKQEEKERKQREKEEAELKKKQQEEEERIRKEQEEAERKKQEEEEQRRQAELEKMREAELSKEIYIPVAAEPQSVEEPIDVVTIDESHAKKEGGKNKKDKKNKGKDGKQQQTDNAPQVAQEEEVVITRTGELGQEKPNQKEQKSPSTDDVPPQTEMTNGKGKKDKKRKHDSGNDKTSAPVTTSHEKSNGHAVNLEQIELDYYDGKSGHDHSGDNNNQGGGKKKDKKGKNKGGRVNSTSEDTTVISEIRVSKDEMEVDKEIAAITGQPGQISPPIQVHEVSSTAEDDHANGTTVTTEVITASIPVDSKELTEDLIKQYASQALRASDCKLIESDPSVKLKIDAQLVKLAERKPVVIMETKQYIKPLPLELQTSRPSTPINKERMYKLLPKDIIFCSNLIDNHGENYNGMASDPLNIYNENARGLQRKIRVFKESPHYQTYLRAKEEGKPIEEMVAQLEGH